MKAELHSENSEAEKGCGSVCLLVTDVPPSLNVSKLPLRTLESSLCHSNLHKCRPIQPRCLFVCENYCIVQQPLLRLVANCVPLTSK